MALLSNSKTVLNALLQPVVLKDPAVVAALQSAAQRLLTSSQSTAVLSIINVDGWSATPIPAGATALAALIADIAAN